MQAHLQVLWHSFLSSYDIEEFDTQMHLVKKLTSLESATPENWLIIYISLTLISFLLLSHN